MPGRQSRDRIQKLIEEARTRARLKKAAKRGEELPVSLDNPTVGSLLKVPEWVRCMGVTDPTVQFKINLSTGTSMFVANPGPQTWSLMCPYDEVLIGGRRGGGKSIALTAWMASGDVTLGELDPARPTYLNDPSFRGLFLREEYQSMVEFIDYAREFFQPFGGRATGGNSKPVVVEFPSGAKIYFNHLQDDSAFEKYRGWNITRIGIEELTQIPTLKRYLRLMGSLRSVERIRDGRRYPELRTQVMASCNPDGPGACIPYGDVLSQDGWKDIRDIRVGERVWSVSPSTGEMQLKKVQQVHQSQFSGDMYKVEGRGLTVECTPNHKILRLNTTKDNRNSLKLQAIKDFPGQVNILRSSVKWNGAEPPYVYAPKLRSDQRADRYTQPEYLQTFDFACLVGWMVTEGSCIERDSAICICQLKHEGRDTITDLLNRCGFKYSRQDKQFTIYSRQWYAMFSWMPHAKDKYIPEWIKNFETPSLIGLLYSMMDGDGHWDTTESGTFYSCSRQLASDFAEIALKCGYIVYSLGRMRDGGGTINGRPIINREYSYEVAFHKQDVPGSEVRTGNHKYSVRTSTKRLNTKKVTYDGPVYCIGVEDNHTFIVRQKGCVWISGNSWVKDRFVYVPDGNGRNIDWNTPMRDPNTGLVRIFIPFPKEANPYLADSTAAGRKYTAMLLSQDEVTRKQWIEGDWNAGSSRFFLDYRPDGPLNSEEREKFPWAFHIIEPIRLQPWWFRWGSGDWGYDHPSAMHKLIRNEDDGRVHVYDELQVRRVGSFELGALLAKWWYPELAAMEQAGGDPIVVIHFGADIFKMSDETKTAAQQISEGIREVLGPYGALLLKHNEEEKDAALKDPKRAQMLFERRKNELQGHMRLAIKPVYVDRVKAWSYMREWLRFRPAVLPLQTDEERQTYLQQVYKEQGMLAYELQAQELKNLKPEILPKLKIWAHCKEIDRCLRMAENDNRNDSDTSRISRREDVRKFNADDEGKNGDDALESVRNAAIAFQDIQTIIPRSYFVNERIASAQKLNVESFGSEITDPTRLAMISARQNALYSKTHGPANKYLTPHRAGASSRLVN